MLRFRVSGTPDLEVFLSVGEKLTNDMLTALEGAGVPFEGFERVLDFGCGCGRTLAWLHDRFPDKHYCGTDVDASAIEWCREHLRFGVFRPNDRLSPLVYADETFDLAYAISVFTHLNEEMQLQWLAELRRVLRSGGVALLTVHGRNAWQKLPPPYTEKIERDGFLFLASTKQKGLMPDWYQTAYHHEKYVFREFRRFFRIVAFVPGGMGYQDVVIAQRE